MLTAVPGDTLLMSTSITWTNQVIIFSGNGSDDNPITLRSDSTSGAPVILNGSSRISISGTYLVVDSLRFEGGAVTQEKQHVIEFRTSSSDLASDCRLTNTAVIDYNPSPVGSVIDTRWVGLYGTYNRVDHCYFYGKDHKGALLIVWRRSDDTPDYHTIDSNYFGDFASGFGENGWETMRIGTSSNSLSDSSTTIKDNLFEECNGEIEIISIKSGNNLIQGNTFRSNEGSLTLRHGRGNTVDGNFFIGKTTPVVDRSSGGIRVIDSDHVVINNYFEGMGSNSDAAIVLANGLENSALSEYFPTERALIAFNTMYNCKEAFRIGWRSSANTVKVTDSTIANNVVFSTSGVASVIINEEAAPINMLYEGNYMYGAGVVLGLSPVPTGISEVDPDLVLGVGGLHRPSTTSPCIDNAVGSYLTVVVDMDGQSRPSGQAKDVGADEVSTGTATSGPSSSSDIGGKLGPSWWA